MLQKNAHSPVEELLRDPELTRRTIQGMEEADVIALYRKMYPMFCHQDPVETLVFGEFHYWVWEYGEGTGERARRFQEFMLDISPDEHARIALHPETWNKVVKPKLNGDGTVEGWTESLIFKSKMNRVEKEGPCWGGRVYLGDVWDWQVTTSTDRI